VTRGKIEKEPLSVNLYVNFAYNSDELSSDARITLDHLGAALRDPRLEGFAFLIAGHTDAKGSAEYNQKLSERRAEAVKRYLISQYKLPPQRLSAVGYGMSQLLDPSRPEDAINRRVQIINTTTEKNESSDGLVYTETSFRGPGIISCGLTAKILDTVEPRSVEASGGLPLYTNFSYDKLERHADAL
jgi:hypothetical protein